MQKGLNVLSRRSSENFLSTGMQSTLETVGSLDNTEIGSLLAKMTSQGSCGALEGVPCSNGCWFNLAAAGCNLGASCTHCHEEVCCVLSDIRRREIRREHSRLRPAKKKREHIKRMKALGLLWETESVSTAGCESSHSAIGTGPVSPEPSFTNVPDDMRNIANMVELIRIAVESDGFKL
jgi:hypothetical protein